MHLGDVFQDRGTAPTQPCRRRQAAPVGRRRCRCARRPGRTMPHQGVDFWYSAWIRRAARLTSCELRIVCPGPPLLGELLVDRMVHRDDELQEDDRTAAFQVCRQFDLRQPPIAGALAAQVYECPVRRVKRAYSGDEGSRRGPQCHRPVAHPAGHPARSGQLGQDLAMRQRIPGQVGNVRKACTQFRHGGIVTMRHQAAHQIIRLLSTIDARLLAQSAAGSAIPSQDPQDRLERGAALSTSPPSPSGYRRALRGRMMWSGGLRRHGGPHASRVAHGWGTLT